MGCDIHGSIEMYKYDRWRQVGRLIWFVGRSYDTFGCLFGVRNSSNITPLFPKRGFPDEKSRRLKERIEEMGGMEHLGSIGFHSPSWFTLDELDAVDWEESAEEPDQRVSVVDADGNTQIKAGYLRRLDEQLSGDEFRRVRNGERVQLPDRDGEERYAVCETLKRKHALSGAWEWLLFEYLETLADRVDDRSEIRLTVWFDN